MLRLHCSGILGLWPFRYTVGLSCVTIQNKMIPNEKMSACVKQYKANISLIGDETHLPIRHMN